MLKIFTIIVEIVANTKRSAIDNLLTKYVPLLFDNLLFKNSKQEFNFEFIVNGISHLFFSAAGSYTKKKEKKNSKCLIC